MFPDRGSPFPALRPRVPRRVPVANPDDAFAMARLWIGRCAIADPTNRTGFGTPIRTACATCAPHRHEPARRSIRRCRRPRIQVPAARGSAWSCPIRSRRSRRGTPPHARPHPRRTAPDGAHVSRHTICRGRGRTAPCPHLCQSWSTSLCMGFRTGFCPTSCPACNDNARADWTSLCPASVCGWSRSAVVSPDSSIRPFSST